MHSVRLAGAYTFLNGFLSQLVPVFLDGFLTGATRAAHTPLTPCGRGREGSMVPR